MTAATIKPKLQGMDFIKFINKNFEKMNFY